MANAVYRMKLIIDYEPTPKGVPRVKYISGRVITYYHWKTTQALEAIRTLIKDMNLEPFPKHTPLRMEVTFWRTKSKWLAKKEQLPFRKPDNSNFIKLIEDCLSGTVIYDDAVITTTIAKKRWSPNNHGYIEIVLEEDIP